MKKTTKKLIILVIIFIFFVIFFIPFFEYFKIDKILIKEVILSESQKVQNAIKNYEAIECSFGLLNPSYSIVSFQHYVYPEKNVDMKIWQVDFYNLSRPHVFSSNWSIKYTGSSDIKNTTFPELVKMVKEDCSQFQQSKGDFNDKTINWSYSEYVPEPPEPQLTEDEIAIQKELEEIKRQKSIENRKDYKPIEFKIINE